jgi:tRNA/rRNA methyltransferase
MTPPDPAPTRPIVILCRPQIGENVGAAARAMLNFGLTELRLVRPDFGWPSGKAVAAASGAAEVMNGVVVAASLEAAMGDVQHMFATTARTRELRKPVLTPEAAAGEIAGLCAEGRRVALLFGPERTGLTNEEAALADALVTIPTNPRFSSLNLAQAVLVLAYECFKARERPPSIRHPLPGTRPASKAEVQGLIDHLVRELDAVDFFRTPDRRQSLVLAITQLFERRALATHEVDLLRGIVKDLVGGRKARVK